MSSIIIIATLLLIAYAVFSLVFDVTRADGLPMRPADWLLFSTALLLVIVFGSILIVRLFHFWKG